MFVRLNMSGMCLTISKALLVAVAIAQCQAGEPHWPNLSCHPANSSRTQQDMYNFNRMAWRSCLESYEEYKGNCVYLCRLNHERIFLRKAAGAPVTFDVEAVIKYFAEELGYSMKSVGGPEQERMAKIRSEMESCKLKHPEYAGMKSIRKTPCEPWKNFLECFDKAMGCGVWALDKKKN